MSQGSVSACTPPSLRQLQTAPAPKQLIYFLPHPEVGSYSVGGRGHVTVDMTPGMPALPGFNFLDWHCPAKEEEMGVYDPCQANTQTGACVSAAGFPVNRGERELTGRRGNQIWSYWRVQQESCSLSLELQAPNVGHPGAVPRTAPRGCTDH